MKPESFTLDWSKNIIVVVFEDGSSKEYTNIVSYVNDWPDRKSDADAMNWKQ